MIHDVEQHSAKEPKAEVLFDLPPAEYHAPEIGRVSNSALTQIARSPAHYLQWLKSSREPTPAMLFGRAFHMALLEPERFAATHVTPPDFGDCRFKENKARRDAWRKENEGREYLDSGDAETITSMIAAVRSHPLVSRLMSEGEAEVTIRWTDPATGLPCQCRPDWLRRDLKAVLDFKSVEDASAEAFRKSIAKFRYHVQDALYRDGTNTAGIEVDHFLFVAVEKSPPYGVGVYSLGSDGVGRGYQEARRNIDTLAECVKTNRWPGYSESIQVLNLPSWAA